MSSTNNATTGLDGKDNTGMAAPSNGKSSDLNQLGVVVPNTVVLQASGDPLATAPSTSKAAGGGEAPQKANCAKKPPKGAPSTCEGKGGKTCKGGKSGGDKTRKGAKTTKSSKTQLGSKSSKCGCAKSVESRTPDNSPKQLPTVEQEGSQNPDQPNDKTEGVGDEPSSAGVAGDENQSPPVSAKRKPKPKGPGHSGTQGRKASRHNAEVVESVANGIDSENTTRWYLAAVKKGFKTDKALDAFNRIVRPLENLIHPYSVPICTECGHAEVWLCSHFVTSGPVVEIEDDVVAIPPVEVTTIKWRFAWVEGVRRMFTWPKFDFDAVINRGSRGFHPSLISDELLWVDMLNYIRLHLHTSYKLDGKFNREAKLAHCRKLALRFLTDRNIKPTDVTDSQTINRISLTVARACDQRDDSVLYKEDDPRQNFWLAPGALWNHWRLIALGAGIIVPVLTIKLGSVWLRVGFWALRRMFWTNGTILLNGSRLVFDTLHQKATEAVNAAGSEFYHGLIVPSSNQIRQLSTKIVDTTFVRVSPNDILNRLWSPRPICLTTTSLNALSSIWQRTSNQNLGSIISVLDPISLSSLRQGASVVGI